MFVASDLNTFPVNWGGDILVRYKHLGGTDSTEAPQERRESGPPRSASGV